MQPTGTGDTAGVGPCSRIGQRTFEVQPAAVAYLVAYVHMNPVRAGVCQKPVDSRWTSHQAYLRLTPLPPGWMSSRALALCGFEDTDAGRRDFDEFVRRCETRHWQVDARR